MTKNKAIELLFKDKECIGYCLRVSSDKNIADDLMQYACEQLLLKPDRLIRDLQDRGALKRFFAGIVYKSFNSNRSNFYNEHMKAINLSEELREIEEESFSGLNISIEEINNELIKYEVKSEKNWYEASIFKLYLNHGNLRSLSKSINIPVSSLAISVNNVKKHLKETLCEKYF